jgi:hypothetical protein
LDLAARRQSNRRFGLNRLQLSQPERQEQERYPHHDRERCDHPQDGKRARQRVPQDENCERDAEDSAEDQPELTFDLLAESNAEHDLHDAHDEGPNRDVEQQHERGNLGRLPSR